MVAMSLIPRLPTPIATRAPGFNCDAKDEAAKLAPHFTGHVRNSPIGKILPNQQHARKR